MGTGGMGIEGHLRAGSFSFLGRLSCSGLALVESYAQFPHGSLPTGIYGCLGGQEILKGFVGTCPELQFVHWGSNASSPGNGSRLGRGWQGCPLESLLLPQCLPERRSPLVGMVCLASGEEPSGLLQGWASLGMSVQIQQLDVSSTAWDMRFLTSIVMFPSDFRGDFWGMATMVVEILPKGSIFWSCSSIGGDGISIPK